MNISAFGLLFDVPINAALKQGMEEILDKHNSRWEVPHAVIDTDKWVEEAPGFTVEFKMMTHQKNFTTSIEDIEDRRETKNPLLIGLDLACGDLMSEFVDTKTSKLIMRQPLDVRFTFNPETNSVIGTVTCRLKYLPEVSK